MRALQWAAGTGLRDSEAGRIPQPGRERGNVWETLLRGTGNAAAEV